MVESWGRYGLSNGRMLCGDRKNSIANGFLYHPSDVGRDPHDIRTET